MTQNNYFKFLAELTNIIFQLMITLYCLIFFSFLVTSTYRYVGNPFFMIFNCSWVCEKLVSFFHHLFIVMTQNNYFKFLAELTNIIFFLKKLMITLYCLIFFPAVSFWYEIKQQKMSFVQI